MKVLGRGGDARLVFVLWNTCQISNDSPFRALQELILRFGAVKVQKWPKKRLFTGKAVFCGLKAPNLRISLNKEQNGNEYLILSILGEINTIPASVPPPAPSRWRREC